MKRARAAMGPTRYTRVRIEFVYVAPRRGTSIPTKLLRLATINGSKLFVYDGLRGLKLSSGAFGWTAWELAQIERPATPRRRLSRRSAPSNATAGGSR